MVKLFFLFWGFAALFIITSLLTPYATMGPKEALFIFSGSFLVSGALLIILYFLNKIALWHLGIKDE